MIAAVTLQRLVEGLGTGTRMDEKHIRDVDGRDEDGMLKAFAAVVRSQAQAVTDTVL
jgi:hypothetical protein